MRKNPEPEINEILITSLTIGVSVLVGVLLGYIIGKPDAFSAFWLN